MSIHPKPKRNAAFGKLIRGQRKTKPFPKITLKDGLDLGEHGVIIRVARIEDLPKATSREKAEDKLIPIIIGLVTGVFFGQWVWSLL